MTKTNFISFSILNLLTRIMSIRFLVKYEYIEILGRDSILYVNLTDIIYTGNSIYSSKLYPYITKIFPFYPAINYLCYIIFGNSYLTLQMFYFFIIFTTNFLLWYALKTIRQDYFTADKNSNNVATISSFMQPKYTFILYTIYFINFVVFSVQSNRLMPENLLLGLSMASFLCTYTLLKSNNFLNYFLCLVIYTFTTLTKPQGISIVIGITVFSILTKNRRLLLITLISFIPLIIYLLLFSRYEGSYSYAHIFYNYNFSSLVYGIYRLLFCIPYELFFSDALTRRLEVFKESYGIMVYFPKYLISLLLWICVISGFIKINKTGKFFSKFGYITITFIISVVGFICHTPVDARWNPFFFDARLFIYLWPIFVISYITFHIYSSGIIKKFTTLLIILIITCNLFLLSKNFYNNITELAHHKWKLESISLDNNYKVLCLNYKSEVYEHKLISYGLFRKMCDTEGNLKTYDYIIDFSKSDEIKGFKKVFTGEKWGYFFSVFKRE